MKNCVERGNIMKKIFSVIFNVVPFFIWMIWFYCALEHFTIDLGIIQILLLLGLPLLYSIFNTIFASGKKEFVIHNTIFGASQVIGYYIAGLLYYNYISSDSETALITNTFSGISIVYIFLLTLVFYGIWAIVYKVKNK